MNLSPQTVSPEEQEQILQTIEMFEVIIQASPQDCQSMEILKDAYQRVGRAADAQVIARRLADTYVELGQYSQAMFEYEGILQKDPTNPEVIAAMSDLEEKLRSPAVPTIEPVLPASGGILGSVTLAPPADLHTNNKGLGIDLDFQAVVGDGGTLIATEQTVREFSEQAKIITPEQAVTGNEGNAALAKFLVQNRLVPEEAVNSALERVTKKNAERQLGSLPLSLIDQICRRGVIDLEALLCGIVDRSKFAYIPLEYYDVDRAVVRMLPENLTMGCLMVPFDVMSRTIMIATANPFDAAAKETAQQMLDYNIQWHLAAPQAIAQALSSVYKIDAAKPEAIPFRLSQ
ncbi:GspE/PulE/PilB domain-containing protein [Verrucomicrobiota bacterium sgz303538]